MPIRPVSSSVFVPQPPPLWYVTNGERSVGPVVTGMLVRGVEEGRVPAYCHVRVIRGDWRSISSVREVAASNSKLGLLPTANCHEAFFELSQQLGHIKDEDEFLNDLTQLAVTTTSAESAMLHCLERRGNAMVTRAVLGPMPQDRLGHPLDEADLVLQAAQQGRPVLGPPFGPTEDALAMRFASSHGGVGAVAMLPVLIGGDVVAQLELARPGHAFRRGDLQRVERIIQRALRLRRN